MTTENLVLNAELTGSGQMPEGWTFGSPRKSLEPRHAVERLPHGETRLVLESTGCRYAFGCWRGSAKLQVGNWYRATVRAQAENIERPALSVFAQVAKHFLVPRDSVDQPMVLERVFRHGEPSDGNAVELYLKATESGRVVWSKPCVTRIPEPAFRTARVATIRLGKPRNQLTMEQQRSRIAEKLDQAGRLSPDIVALTEVAPIAGIPREVYGSFAVCAETVPDGLNCRIAANAARKHGMYVLIGMIERRGDFLFNTAVLFDRQGELCGQYDKTHLTFIELEEGISCGDGFPVFDLDFGRIGIHICYDEWFPEVARYYAHQGVDILFLPVMGGKPITWRTRALDNGIYFVSASWGPPSMIIDSSGIILAETHGDGVASADLNLDYRETNWYGDPTLSYGVPCIAPQMRMRLSDRILDDLHQAMKP